MDAHLLTERIATHRNLSPGLALGHAIERAYNRATALCPSSARNKRSLHTSLNGVEGWQSRQGCCCSATLSSPDAT
jgi:hypothetical protein